MARFDFGLSDEEFEELTPGEFQALCKRRNIRIKYERYANAQTAAAVYNTSRYTADDPVVSAFDFVRDADAAEKLERIRKAKKFITQALSLPMSTSREKFLEIRTRVIEDLKASGYGDAEALVNQAFPSLKPKKGG
jgi:hypothetical protein